MPKSSSSVKSLVMPIFLLQTALGSATGMALSPSVKGPHSVTFYSCLLVVTVLAGSAFWFCFKKHNATEEEMNTIDENNEELGPRAVKDMETALGRLKKGETRDLGWRRLCF